MVLGGHLGARTAPGPGCTQGSHGRASSTPASLTCGLARSLHIPQTLLFSCQDISGVWLIPHRCIPKAHLQSRMTRS